LDLLERGESSCDEADPLVGIAREWIVDSGALKHMTPWKEGLQNLQTMKGEVFLGDDSTVSNCGIGELHFILDSQGGLYTSDVLYVPGLSYHLLSVKELCRLGLLVEFFEEQFWIRDRWTKKVVCEGVAEQGVYKLGDTGARASNLQSPGFDADWMEHDQHVLDEGEIAEDQGSVMGDWLQEYLHVNHGLMAHAVEDTDPTEVGGQ